MNFEIDTLVHYYELLLQRLEDLEGQMQQVRDGSIVTHISEAIHWSTTGARLTGGTDYTVDGAWTDLSLKTQTSGKAKYVFLLLIMMDTCVVDDYILVRKNGETATYAPGVRANVAAKFIFNFAICGMDADQKVEYYATDASDTLIDILGYIE